MVSPASGTLSPPTWATTGSESPILIVESDADRRSALSTALRGTTSGVVEACASVPTISSHPWGLVTLDTQAVKSEQMDEIHARFRDLHEAGRVILRVPSSERYDMLRWFGRGARHVICRDEPHAQEDVLSAARKLLWQGSVGAECYLHSGARTWSLSLLRSRDKTQVFELCRDIEPQLALGKRKLEALETIAEELITNAFYNAPVDAQGRRRFAHLGRREDVVLLPEEAIRVTIASDSDRVAISVKDPFGSLPPATVPGYLSKCMQRGEDQVDNKQGGAGLGLYFVYQSVSHLAVNIAPGRFTELLGFLDLSTTAGAIQRRAHSFGLFVVDDDTTA
jgi:hypothetical protein